MASVYIHHLMPEKHKQSQQNTAMGENERCLALSDVVRTSVAVELCI